MYFVWICVRAKHAELHTAEIVCSQKQEQKTQQAQRNANESM